MKITSGRFKYRKIEVPKGIRPTTEKVREAVFSMIMPWLPDAAVLDLFAGSGAMGLEALSRGAAHCWFCELNRQNQKVLSANISGCGASDCSTLFGTDYKAAITRLAGEGVKLDIVILDPPYAETDNYTTAAAMLADGGLLEEGSIIVAEHLYDNPLPDTLAGFSRIKSKRYGSIGVEVYML